MSQETVEHNYNELESKASFRQILLERCHRTLFQDRSDFKERIEFRAKSKDNPTDSKVRMVFMNLIMNEFGSNQDCKPDDIDDEFVIRLIAKLRENEVPLVYMPYSYTTPQEHEQKTTQDKLDEAQKSAKK